MLSRRASAHHLHMPGERVLGPRAASVRASAAVGVEIKWTAPQRTRACLLRRAGCICPRAGSFSRDSITGPLHTLSTRSSQACALRARGSHVVERVALGLDARLLVLAHDGAQLHEAVLQRLEADAQLLSDLGACGPFHFLPDIVHSLAPAPRDVNAIEAMEPQARNLKLLERMAGCCENTMPPAQLRNKNVAVFLSDHYYDYKTISATNVLEGIEREAADKMYVRHLRMAMDELLQYYNIYFFSLSFWYNSIDSFVGYQLARSSRNAPLYNLVNRYLEPAEILALMPYFDLAISMKFHGLIFPMAAGVSVMNLGTSKKNQDLAKQMGLVSVLPEELTVPGFLQALKQVESLEYTTSVAETQRLARESILTAFAQPRLWD